MSSLYDMNLSLYDVPVTPVVVPVPVPVVERAYTVTLKNASNGAEILLCNVSPPPTGARDEAARRKLPLFTFDEIPAIRQAAASDPRHLEFIIEARRVMGWGGPITFKEEPA